MRRWRHSVMISTILTIKQCEQWRRFALFQCFPVLRYRPVTRTFCVVVWKMHRVVGVGRVCGRCVGNSQTVGLSLGGGRKLATEAVSIPN